MTQAFIAVRGGLGNQMFQAAMGAALLDAYGVDVRFLADALIADGFGRQYHLDRFPALRGRTASLEEAEGAIVVGEPAFDPTALDRVFREQPKVIFDGYWQNEAYLLGRHDAVAAAFRFDPSEALIDRAAQLREAAPIGVHVRRAEYGHHGLAAADYYRTAIAAIRAERGDAPVVCFTDEPNVVRFIFQDIPGLQVMIPNTEEPADDLFLLSQCRHFVIANSSFSWWAAWLGARDDAIVYAPLPWCVFDLSWKPAPARWRAVEGAVRAP